MPHPPRKPLAAHQKFRRCAEKHSEAQLMRRILLAVGSRPDVRLWRANTGVGVTPDGARIVRFGIPGQADLSGLLIDGRRLEIEVKMPGRTQSEAQLMFGEMILRYGGVYLLAHSVEEALAGVTAAIAR